MSGFRNIKRLNLVCSREMGHEQHAEEDELQLWDTFDNCVILWRNSGALRQSQTIICLLSLICHTQFLVSTVTTCVVIQVCIQTGRYR